MDAETAALSAGSRDVPLTRADATAVLVIDMQNAFCHIDSALWKNTEHTEYIDYTLDRGTSCMKRIIDAARACGVEVMYTVVESLTKDGRERSLDYKLSGINVPRASWGSKVIEKLEPANDEIVLPKGSSSVFMSTNISYLLRNLKVKQLVIIGGLTDQCVDSAVRDACDEGFLVTLVTDACYTHTEERHSTALANNSGYCRQLDTDTILGEFAMLKPSASASSSVHHQPNNIVRTNGITSHNQSYGEPIRNSNNEANSQLTRTNSPTRGEYIRYELYDYNGRSQSKLVPARHRNKDVFIYSGCTAAGANSEVLEFPPEIQASGFYNSKLYPFWDTFIEIPWACSPEAQVKRVICEQELSDGSREHVPRAVLRRLLQDLEKQHGLWLLSASEFEFCVSDKNRKPLFNGPEIFVTLQNMKTMSYQVSIERSMHAVGIDIKTSNVEYGSGQLEITYAPKFGIDASDAGVTFRTGVKEIAQSRGFIATFCSSPFSLTGCGNGGHLNFSLWRTGGQIPVMGAGELSMEARKFLAGILRHAPAMEAFCSPTPCCYARHGNWAPSRSDWGIDDRLRLVRVKLSNEAEHQYFEFRAPSSSSNPYLATAALLAAGLLGLENDYELPSPQENDAQLLPKSLEDALETLEKDAIFVSRIGATLVRWFVQVKRGELSKLKQWENQLIQDEGITPNLAKLKAYQRMYFEFL